MPETRQPIGAILVRHGVIDTQTLTTALNSRRRGDPPLASRLVDEGIITEHQALKALSEQTGFPGIDLAQVIIRMEDLRLVPRQMAERHSLLPVLVKGNRMFVAMADPSDERVVHELEMLTGKKAFPYVALKLTLRRAVLEAYDGRDQGRLHYVGARCSSEMIKKAGVTEPPPSPSRPKQGARWSGAPVDEAPSLQLERRLRPSRPGVSVDRPVIVDDTMAAATGPSNNIVFDEPTYTDLEAPPAAEPAPDSGRVPLLLVDSDEELRRTLASVFTERGYRVIEADRGDMALQLVREHVPDVIVLEATLPVVHGFEVARQLKTSERYRSTKIVMISALYRGWRIAEDLKANYGVDRFLEKPFRVDDIVHAVETTVDQAPDRASVQGTSARVEPYLKAGIAAYKAGQLDDAVQHLRAGTEVDPLAYKVRYHLGLLYGKRGQLYDGIQELETALSIRSDFFPALKNLAVLYQNAGFRNKAIEMWERCLVNAPDEQTRDEIKRHLVAVL
jgi:DNA-binding response OmpR family regulator